jgi:hypothetical protein
VFGCNEESTPESSPAAIEMAPEGGDDGPDSKAVLPQISAGGVPGALAPLDPVEPPDPELEVVVVVVAEVVPVVEVPVVEVPVVVVLVVVVLVVVVPAEAGSGRSATVTAAAFVDAGAVLHV